MFDHFYLIAAAAISALVITVTLAVRFVRRRRVAAASKSVAAMPAHTRANKALPWALGICAGIAIGAIWYARDAKAASVTRACGSLQADPPLVVVLPDGTEVRAARIDYDLAARRVEIVGEVPQLFCNSYEGATP